MEAVLTCTHNLCFRAKIRYEAVLTCTYNLCFRAKIRKNVYPYKPQFYYIKVGCKGVFISRTCLHDVNFSQFPVFTRWFSQFRGPRPYSQNTEKEHWTLFQKSLEIAQILISFVRWFYHGMGNNVNVLLTTVYEYNRVTTASRISKIFVLYMFYVLFSFLNTF